jgi:hypothetical protein
MTVVVAVISSALALAGMPPRGLALETRAGIDLQTLSGRSVASLARLDLALDQGIAHKVVLRDPRGGLFVLDARGLRRTVLRRGCRRTDADLVVCARTIRRGGRVVACAPAGGGSWVWAEAAPRGDAILAQWSGECEIPAAYLVTHGRLRSYGSETVALGWLPSGEAIVHFRAVGCAGSGRNGIYAIARSGASRLILRTPRLAQYAMWGG